MHETVLRAPRCQRSNQKSKQGQREISPEIPFFLFCTATSWSSIHSREVGGSGMGVAQNFRYLKKCLQEGPSSHSSFILCFLFHHQMKSQRFRIKGMIVDFVFQIYQESPRLANFKKVKLPKPFMELRIVTREDS